jgi:hypothetical protein
MRLFLFCLCGVALAQMPDCSLVPGWTQQGPARSYVADTLFEYMDGNAEGYLIYRFIKMDGVNCRSGSDTVIVDVSEMADPEYAYGIFAANRDLRVPAEPIGMVGQVVPRRAFFAKDKYFVDVAIDRDAPEIVRAFALAMEKRIAGRTALPDPVGWFPPEKLVPESVRLVPESVLGLRLLKSGYIAQYEFGKAFLVTEESPQTAVQVMTKLRARIGETRPSAVADESFEAADKYLGRLCFFRKGKYLGGFVGLPEGADAAALASGLAARLP